MTRVGVSIIALSSYAALAGASADASTSAKEQARMRKIAFDYASCVVRRHHDKASEAILSTVGNHAIMTKFSQIIDSDCLVGAAGMAGDIQMRFPNDTYMYALADALVNADLSSRDVSSFKDRLPLAQPSFVTADEQSKRLAAAKNDRARKDVQDAIDQQNAMAWLFRYGECVVRRDPVGARYWLLTRPELPEEWSRIKAMQPAFNACLDEGTFKFNRVTIRGTVAVNYYRLAMATVVPGAESVH